MSRKLLHKKFIAKKALQIMNNDELSIHKQVLIGYRQWKNIEGMFFISNLQLV